MALILQDVTIYWNEDIDNFLTKVESNNEVLSYFFAIKEWDIIKVMHESVVSNEDFHYEDRGFNFVNFNSVDFVDIVSNDEETRLHREDFMTLIQHLFDLMIDGANADHHSVRYEPWFELFTQNANVIRGGETLSSSDYYAYEASILERGY